MQPYEYSLAAEPSLSDKSALLPTLGLSVCVKARAFLSKAQIILSAGSGCSGPVLSQRD